MHRKPTKNYNSQLMELLAIRPIAFNPIFAKIAKSANAGLFLSQILYWWHKGSDSDWIYKTIEEVSEETCLSRSEQDTAIKIWKSLGVIKTKLARVPPKRHFHVEEELLENLLKKHVSESNLSKTANQFTETNTSIRHPRQNTTESTTENTNRDSSLQEVFVKSEDLTAGGFKSFWALYPRKVGKQDAVKAWSKLKLNHSLQEKIMMALEQQIDHYLWSKHDPQFIPHPTTWLNNERWEDEL